MFEKKRRITPFSLILVILFFVSGCGSDVDLFGNGPDSSSNPSGSSTPLPDLSAQNVYFVDSAGLATFLGEITSASAGSNACNVQVSLKVTLLTGAEKTFSIPVSGRVKLLSGETNPQCLDKGETGSFRYTTDVSTLLVSDFEITSVSSEYKDISSPRLASSIQVNGAIQETTVNNVQRYSGTLRNSDAAETAFFPSMTITTLDTDGKVTGLFTVYLNIDLDDTSAVCQPDGSTDVPCLKPGQSLTFTIDTDLDPSEIDSFYDQIHWLETADFN